MPSYATAFGPVPFTARESRHIGLSRDQLRMLVATGKVRRVLRGVYVDAEVPDSLELRARAVAMVVPPGSVICGRTAAWLWGIDALAMSAYRVLPAVDVMAAAGRSAPRRSGAFGCSGPLPDEELVLLAGVMVTTPARTAADLARLLRRPDALASLDAMLRLPELDREHVRSVLDRFGRYRGVVQARELLELADPRAESPQESRTRLRCIDAGFPCPEPQIEVFDPLGLFVARLDMGWRELCKAVEFDGDEHHSRLDDQRHDRRRRGRAERQGWDIAVVTSEHVLGRSLAFEHGVAELLGQEFRLTRNHPRFGGWDGRSRWAT
jgi:hypothetical protein